MKYIRWQFKWFLSDKHECHSSVQLHQHGLNQLKVSLFPVAPVSNILQLTFFFINALNQIKLMARIFSSILQIHLNADVLKDRLSDAVLYLYYHNSCLHVYTLFSNACCTV